MAEKNLSSTEVVVSVTAPLVHAAVRKAMMFALRGVRDTAALKPLLDMVAQAGDLSKFAEGGVNTLFQQYGGKIFSSKVYEDFWKHTAGNLVMAIAEVAAEIDSGREVTVGEVEAKVTEAVKAAVDEQLYVLDEGGQMHRRSCPHVVGRAKRLIKVSLTEAMNEGYPLAGCCASKIRKEAKLKAQKAAAPPPRPKFHLGADHSFMDIIGILDERDRKAIIQWLEGLSDHELGEMMKYAQFIDTEAEVIALVAMPASMRMRILPGLKTKADEREAPKRALQAVGEFLLGCGMNIRDFVQWTAESGEKMLTAMASSIKEFDDSLAPTADRLEKEFKELAAPRKVPWSFWKLFGF